MTDSVEPQELLRNARSILLIDWPSRDVPDTLAKSGFAVVTDAGRGRGYVSHEFDGNAVVMRKVDALPALAEIVYAHRPIDELPFILERASAVHATAIWLQSGRDAAGNRDPKACWLSPDDSRRAREIVESAGLNYIENAYIADAARSLGASPRS